MTVSASSSSISLQLKVSRCKPELVTPAKPTPREFKPLSDIDGQETLRFQSPFVHIYSSSNYEAANVGKDPVKVFRNATADALVFYYPFAGRLRELPGRKLVVDCTGEGVIFTEANANVRLDQFGDTLVAPSPWLKDLLYDVPGSAGLLDAPLLLIQVTRLMCGGFIFAYRFNHTMCDGVGLAQFMMAIAEMARGASVPSVLPVWNRELLDARNPEQSIDAACVHRQYDELNLNDKHFTKVYPMIHRNFFFTLQDIKALRKHVQETSRRPCSAFEILTACLWRSRVIAHSVPPEDEVRLILTVDARRKCSPPLPDGYYGNAAAYPAASTTAGKLCTSPVRYALELVKSAKASVTDKYMRSLANLMASEEGRPSLCVVRTRTFVVSDLTRAGLGDIDFGWGKAVNAGVASANFEVSSPFTKFRNNNGDVGILVPVSLPGSIMEKFEMEVQRMIKEPSPEMSYLHSSL